MIIYNRLKDTKNYATYSKKFLILTLILFLTINILQKFIPTQYTIAISTLITAITLGYGLDITKNTIHQGKRLPKIRPKTIIINGIKGLIISGIYALPQAILLTSLSNQLGFSKIIEIENIILNLPETINTLLQHEPINATLYLILSIILIYISTFFYEISLASFADTEDMKESLKMKKIKRKIEKIGLKNYSIDYTELILTLTILKFLEDFTINIEYVGFIISALFRLLLFITEYRAIGLIYRKIKGE